MTKNWMSGLSHFVVCLLLKMFKFFPDAEEVEGNDKVKLSLRPCEEIQIEQIHYDLATSVPSISLSKFKYPLKYIKISELVNSPIVTKCGTDVVNILNSSSDLLSGEYEGGFKLWECTFDLLTYLEDNTDSIDLGPGVRVLDLGCGHGLLGQHALRKGATVAFQDYNSEVIKFLTIPNTVINFGDEGLSRSRYFAGNWASFKDMMTGDLQFEVILSSETIYNTEYLQDFIELIAICLKPGGSLFLAAKTCYFGVGGGTEAFKSLINKNSELKANTVRVIKQGIQREVLQVKKLSIDKNL